MSMAIGERVRVLREARGWGINELARRAHVAAGNLSRLETGKQVTTTVETIEALCTALDIPLEDFFRVELIAMPGGVRIPLYALGELKSWPPEIGQQLKVVEICDNPEAKQCIAVKITDQSMVGEQVRFCPGDVLIINPNRQPVPGDYVLARAPQGLVVRRYRQRPDGIELAPLNPHWSSRRVNGELGSVVIGVCVEHRCYLRPGGERVAP